MALQWETSPRLKRMEPGDLPVNHRGDNRCREISRSDTDVVDPRSSKEVRDSLSFHILSYEMARPISLSSFLLSDGLVGLVEGWLLIQAMVTLAL